MIHTAYQGNPDLKLSCIHGMKQLIEAKKLTQERTWDVKAYVSAVQTDQTLAELIRALFIQLPEKEAYNWATVHLEAIPVNADLSGVWTNFIKWLLLDKDFGIKHYADLPEINEIFDELTVLNERPDHELAGKLSQKCDDFISNLNVDNDPTNKYLYLCTIAKSIINRFSYQLIEYLQQFHHSLKLNPEEEKKKLMATNEGSDTFHDFEPGAYERMFNEAFANSNAEETHTICSVVSKQLLYLFKSAPIRN